jgi:hypothetical protein
MRSAFPALAQPLGATAFLRPFAVIGSQRCRRPNQHHVTATVIIAAQIVSFSFGVVSIHNFHVITITRIIFSSYHCKQQHYHRSSVFKVHQQLR